MVCKQVLLKVLKFVKSIWAFFYNGKKSDLEGFSEEEYIATFITSRSKKELRETYAKAWEAKNFEIENYWKRANYFWAFQAASFAGYFAVFSSEFYNKKPQVLYFVVCIGFISAMAWVFINIGSKIWQRHWEKHVDMLEDKITGPLYKTVTVEKTYSVSKINDIISRFFAVIWIILGVQYFIENLSFKLNNFRDIDYLVVLSTVTTIYFTGAMCFGYGRGKFRGGDINFYKRNVL
ncbi:MAG: hypothetical protein HGB33_06795 [Syntrophaceae bacterium]|nr:hypothetical protein [Syntrophaceae bacterium]